MADFKLTNEEDTAAIELAIKAARRMLRKRDIDPPDIVGLEDGIAEMIYLGADVEVEDQSEMEI